MELPAIPGYEPVRVLGINGAVIYVARRLSDGELVVVKVYDRTPARRPSHPDSLLARLDHPNILRVFETGDLQGHSFCVLEHVDENLADRLRQAALPRSQAIGLVRAITLAIHYAWQQGVIPMDLSPDCILLAAGSVPKLYSFEATDAVVPRLEVGFSAFMAPEEVAGTAVGVSPTSATLVYRVGGVMYAGLTGRPPFAGGGGTVETVYKILHESPAPPRQVNPTVARDLDGVCMKCLEKHPEHRYASLDQLAEQLAALETTTG